ncbi:MAG: ComEC/Rec2 family competence protein [Planctomycetota bacterium]
MDLPHSDELPRVDTRPRTRAAWTLAACIAGILASSAWPSFIGSATPEALFGAVVCLAGLGLLGGRRTAAAALLAAALMLTAGRATLEHHPPRDHVLHHAAALPIDDAGRQRALVGLTARVRSAPADPDAATPSWERGVFAGDRTAIEVEAEAIDLGDGWTTASGGVRLRVDDAVDAAPNWLTPGSRLEVVGWLHAPVGPRNPGDRESWRIDAATLHTDDWELLAEASGGTWWARARGWLARVRWRVQSGGRSLLGVRADDADPASGLLAALVLGQRDAGFEEAYRPFRRVGLAHLLAISGLHLAILAGAAAWLLRTFVPGWRVHAAGVAVAVGLLLVLVPARTPIVRAGIMVLALLAARALGRRHDPLAVLAWTATAILLFDPPQLFDLGFQLSFGLVAALIALAPRAHATLFGERSPVRGVLHAPAPLWRSGVRVAAGSVARLASATALCWLLSAPAIALHTGLLSPWTVPATIVATPMIAVLLVASYAAIAIAAVAPPVAGALRLPLLALADACNAVVGWFDALPASAVALPRISTALAITATGTAIVVVVRGRRVRWNHGLAVLLVAAWAWTELARPFEQAGQLDVHTLAVGDGTAHLLSSDGEDVLWDCGSIGGGAGATTVRAVRALGLGRVDAAVLTHANLDHANGLPRAMRELGIATLFTTPQAAEHTRRGGAMDDIFDELAELGVQIRTVAAGDRFQVGSATATVLWPPVDARIESPNDASLVALVEAADGVRVLLTADIGGGGLARLLERVDPALLRVDVLELPHHGADDEHARRLVALADARVVIQSAGPARVRQDPWREARGDGLWLVTGRDGAIHVRSRAGLEVAAMRRGELEVPDP